MIVQLDKKAQQVFGKEELVIITERIDDVALLLGQMIKMGLQEVLDRYIPRHWNQRNLSWGWTAVIWLAYILTEGDHRKVSVQEYIEGMKNTLSRLTGQTIEALDFSDDRLTHLLRHLSKPKYWHPIEQDLNAQSIEVYELPQETIRCDATTVSGYHGADGPSTLFQFGHSKDDPSRPQIKLMSASLDPMGMPLATDVLSGERADDGLYIPIIKRVQAGLNRSGLLFVGDCKMSALEIRQHIVSQQDHYLSPLPLTGTTAEHMDEWVSQALEKDRDGTLELVFKTNDKNEKVVVAAGYEFDRLHCIPSESGKRQWDERVLVIRSFAHAEQQGAGLERRLAHAEEKIVALTPPRGRGKRQITEEASLLEAINKVLKQHRVEGLLSIEYEKQIQRQTQYVGPGRGSADREKQVIERVRYQITSIVRQDQKIAELQERFGWKAFVTDVVSSQLSLSEAVLCYRNEYRIERIFNRLKSRLNIAPVFVKRNDQIEGLTYLLTLGVRVLTLIEFVVRRSLQNDQAKLSGLHPENAKKTTDKPTAERILKAFSNLSLTLIKNAAGDEIIRWLTPLSSVQQEILQRLGLGVDLYRQLEIQDSGN